MKTGRKPIAIELYKDGVFQHWFPSVATAADWLGVKPHALSQDIHKGHKSRGYEIRIGQSVEDTVYEIEHRTYQISRP